MTQHAKDFSPSASSRWLNCTASVKAVRHLPNTSSVYAMEGTVAHELAENCLTHYRDTFRDYLGSEFTQYTDDMRPITFIVDHEMATEVDKYVQYVRELIEFDSVVLIEQRVEFTNWVPEGFGTADAVIINNDCVHVVDLKYGKGVAVDAYQNSQLMLYALGVYQLYANTFDLQNFCIHVVQPRRNNFSTYEFKVDELLEFAEYVKQKTTEAYDDDLAVFNPTTKGCEWCPLNATCSALTEYSYKSVSMMFESLDDDDDLCLDNVNQLTPERIAKVLGDRKMIEKHLANVEAFALELAEGGTTIPGYKLVEGRTNRVWRDEKEAEDKLAEHLKIDDILTYKLISPAQLEKLNKSLYADIEKEFVNKPQGKTTLVPVSDKREAITPIADQFEELD